MKIHHQWTDSGQGSHSVSRSLQSLSMRSYWSIVWLMRRDFSQTAVSLVHFQFSAQLRENLSPLFCQHESKHLALSNCSDTTNMSLNLHTHLQVSLFTQNRQETSSDWTDSHLDSNLPLLLSYPGNGSWLIGTIWVRLLMSFSVYLCASTWMGNKQDFGLKCMGLSYCYCLGCILCFLSSTGAQLQNRMPKVWYADLANGFTSVE